MDGDHDPNGVEADDHRGEQSWTDSLPSDHPAVNYSFTLVEYEDRPDQCTICPRSIAPQDLMTTWITARRDTIVDLDAYR